MNAPIQTLNVGRRSAAPIDQPEDSDRGVEQYGKEEKKHQQRKVAEVFKKNVTNKKERN